MTKDAKAAASSFLTSPVESERPPQGPTADLPSMVISVQVAYDLVTGMWPLLSMRSFEALSGPKHDDWLVRTVGALAVVIGGSILIAQRRGHQAAMAPLGLGSAVAFATVDVVGVLRGPLRPIYLADAVMQGVFSVAWLLRSGRGRRPARA